MGFLFNPLTGQFDLSSVLPPGVVTESGVQTLTNKTIDGDLNTITNIGDEELKAGINANKIADGTVSNAEFQYINSLSSNAQNQIDGKVTAIASTDNAVARFDAGSGQLNNSGVLLTDTNDLQVGDGLVGAPAISFTADPDTGMYRSGTNSVSLSGGGEAGLQVVKSAGAFANVGIGGAASTNDGFPLLIERSLGGQVNVQISNPSTDAGSVSKLTQKADNGQVTTELATWNTTIGLDGYEARTVLRSTDSGEGISFIADGASPQDHRFYSGGVTASEKTATITSEAALQLKERALAPTTPATGYGSLYMKDTGFLFQVDDSGVDKQLIQEDTGDVPEGSNLYFTDERAQDAVGIILDDSSKITLAYADATPAITADIVPDSLVDADINSAANINVSKLGTGVISNTEFNYLDNLSSNIQDQFTGKVSVVTGDIAPTSFSMSDGQAVAANVTGFAFANGSVRAFKALASVSVDATADLFETFELNAVQKGSDWFMSVESVGDSSGVVFTITSAGAVQYTGLTYPGFSSGVIKFRAEVVHV